MRASREQATATAKALLAKLGIDQKNVDQLQRISASDLFTASSQVGGNSLIRYEPVVDGRSIPAQTWDPNAPEISASIPMIIGCCKDETTLFAMRDEALFRLDDTGLRDRIVKGGIPEAEADKLISAYRANYSKDTPSDIYFRFATDRAARWNAVKQAELDFAQGKPDVYMYYFAWDTPCADGKIKAFHTAELPLSLRLVRYPESEQLSRQISGASAAFARHGNPKHSGLAWPRYSTTDRTTMIFDARASKAVLTPMGTAAAHTRASARKSAIARPRIENFTKILFFVSGLNLKARFIIGNHYDRCWPVIDDALRNE